MSAHDENLCVVMRRKVLVFPGIRAEALTRRIRSGGEEERGRSVCVLAVASKNLVRTRLSPMPDVLLRQYYRIQVYTMPML